MSDPLRVAFVVEGPTDLIVLEAAIESLLPDVEIVPTYLQPETSAAFEAPGGATGLGWSGVYRWCRQTANEGDGRVSQASPLMFHDLLVVQIDADVAGMTYESGHIEDEIEDLPCKRPCPPASDTTNMLRSVVLRWMGEQELPERAVFCTPSKSMEAWVMAALFPDNKYVKAEGWECHDNPEEQLEVQPIKKRIKKRTKDYEAKQQDIVAAWSAVSEKLTEADRFSKDFIACVETIRK
jgi:hypothetical protein